MRVSLFGLFLRHTSLMNPLTEFVQLILRLFALIIIIISIIIIPCLPHLCNTLPVVCLILHLYYYTQSPDLFPGLHCLPLLNVILVLLT